MDPQAGRGGVLMSAAEEWDPAYGMYVVIIEQRYSPAKNVIGPFRQADAEAWRDRTKALVGALGKTWEFHIARVADPAEWVAAS